MLISNQEVKDLVSGKGVLLPFASEPLVGCYVPDAMFHTVSKKWLLEAWKLWIRSLPEVLTYRNSRGNLRPKWTSESGDCDNLAGWFKSFCQMQNAAHEIQTDQDRSGLAVMTVSLRSDAAEITGIVGAHRLCAYINHRKEVRLFEEQTGDIYEGKEHEWESVRYFSLG